MERLDDLLNNNLKIIQSKDIFAFSMDAVLLAHFATIPKKGKIIDLCTGTGVIPLLMSTKTKTEIYGVEIQEKLVDMANRSVQINHLEGQIRIHHGDLKEAPRYFGKETFDLVTVNPPYMPISGQDHNINEHYAIARHEIATNLKTVINTSAQLLKTGGRLAMVHRPARLGDIITTLREEKLEPKRIRFVHPSLQKEANMVLVEATKFGGKELHILPPLIVYAEDGKYEKEIQQIYFGDGK